MEEPMTHTKAGRRSAFACWAGALALGLALFARDASAAQQSIDPTPTPVLAADASASSDLSLIAPDVASAPDAAPVRVAGGFGISFGVGGLGYGLHPRPYYYPYGTYRPRRVIHHQVVGPRRLKRHKVARAKAVRGPRKVRTAKVVKPKRKLVRSITAAPEATAYGVGGFGGGGFGRGGGFGGSSGGGLGSVGDTTGGGRSTPAFRRVGGGGGGGMTVGDRSGGGRATPTFRPPSMGMSRGGRR
jgi:hypothetical protein